MPKPKVTTGYANINGGRFYYEVAGSGPAVVLVHGFTLDTRMWDSQFEQFARKYTVIRYDVRGFGKSSLPDKPYSNAEDLNGLFDHLRIDRAAVIGLSMGGGIAIEFAVLHQERVSALIPVDSGPRSIVKKEDSSAHAQMREFSAAMGQVDRTARAEGIAAARQHWLGIALFAPERELPQVKKDLERIISGYSGWHWVNTSLTRQFNPEPSELNGRIKVPVLIVVGGRDLPFFHTIARSLCSDIPGSRLHVIPGAGHMSNMDAPEEFNRVVLDFLAGVSH